MDSYSFGMIKPNTKCSELMDTIFGKGLETVIEVVKTWPGYEKIVQQLHVIRVSNN